MLEHMRAQRSKLWKQTEYEHSHLPLPPGAGIKGVAPPRSAP